MACRKTWWRKCVPVDRGIYKDRHARIIIECPENILHLEAEYIYADCPFVTSTLLQSGGGPYIFVSWPLHVPPDREPSLTCPSLDSKIPAQ
jgi:hypothetical protein